MLTFTCDSCSASLYFENDTCLACGHTVGFKPDELAMSTVESATARGLSQCRNWTDYAACNWFTPANAGDAGYCTSCALNEVVPDLTDPQRRDLWMKTERAKRRMIFTLLELGLPLLGRGEKQPLRFRLLADQRADTGEVSPPPEEEPIYIGHDNGQLTLNVVEADDALREAIRRQLNERYRTMLGHIRHEIGHYYWYLLVDGSPKHDAFRSLFGDETADYATSLGRHYSSGPTPDWDGSFVSAYASMHPWEDFAETWAHYIHILDTLETASASALALAGRSIRSPLPLDGARPFASVLEDWVPLSVCLNQLNRSMGMRDAYPFAITPRVAEKLAFVHDLCRAETAGAAAKPSAPPSAPPPAQPSAGTKPPAAQKAGLPRNVAAASARPTAH